MIEFKVNREELKQALAKTQSIVEKKTTKPILSNALLECGKEILTISATDLEVGISIQLPVATQSAGQIALPAKSLYEIAREATSDEITFRGEVDEWLQIVAGRSKFKMACLAPEEFPSMPDGISNKAMSLDAPIFNAMISKTLFAIATDETKYNLSGVFLQSVQGKKIKMVATDGHRLSMVEREMSQKLDLSDGILLPRKGVAELQKLLHGEEGIVYFSIKGRNVIVNKGNTTLFIRLVEGKFPNYEQVIPQETPLQASVSKEAFLGALKRVSLLSQDHNRGVKFTFTSGHLELQCSNPDLGEAKEEIECEYKGQHLTVGFNYRYFLDVLSVLEDDVLSLQFKDEVSPSIIRSKVDPGFLSLIMPMRL